jgi:hypothetical protein
MNRKDAMSDYSNLDNLDRRVKRAAKINKTRIQINKLYD